MWIRQVANLPYHTHNLLSLACAGVACIAQIETCIYIISMAPCDPLMYSKDKEMVNDMDMEIVWCNVIEPLLTVAKTKS